MDGSGGERCAAVFTGREARGAPAASERPNIESEALALDIIIKNASDQPIYEQIYTQLKHHIISGQLQEGDALPSIRGLAKDLKISVITTKRAYDELEKEGFIYTVAGKGCFVAEQNLQLIRENHLKQLESLLADALELSRSLDMELEELIETLRLMAEEE